MNITSDTPLRLPKVHVPLYVQFDDVLPCLQVQASPVPHYDAKRNLPASPLLREPACPPRSIQALLPAPDFSRSLHEYVNKTSELTDYKVHLTDLSNYEKSRITHAVYFLSGKKLIDNKTKEDVISLAEEMNQLRNDHFKEVYETKKQELEEAKKNIDQKVSDWKEQWKE